MTTSSFLYKLFKTSSVYGKVKIGEERQECIAFASFCKAESINGSLNGVWFHVPNENGDNKHKVLGMLLRAMGKISGVSDYIFMNKNTNLCLEFKTQSQYKSKHQGLSDSQLLFKQWCESLEINYHTVCTATEAIKILEKEGFLIKDE